MYLIQSFSSLVENNNTVLINTSKDLLHGLKILHNDKWYICGDLALNEGQSPHKLINSSPDDTDYQLLAKAALIVSQENLEQPICITTGFPYATYHIHKEKAINFFKRTHILDFDSSTYGTGGKKKNVLEVQQVEVIPEIVGCTIGIRRGELQATGSFFVLSCGFGTFESILSTDSGIIEQSMVSAHGIRYAVNIMINELKSKYYLEFRNAHQFDDAFQRGYVYLNRQNIDLREIRRNAIRTYYEDIVSPVLRNIITDKNLMKTNHIYLCGGAMYYQDLVECFREEFEGIAQLEVVENPETMASKGYALNSLRIAHGKKKSALGIDIGNATTIVTNFDDEEVKNY
ncbi:ParM/StbA family protein [Sphingobacterium alkalisoli]|uniref:ParM/StbA family protein n=1 Tax=Sphingobacterium alkalisoli TaxID=1874115 RepID=A0A4U0GRW2_9SPHI|nr:ParM/StbA family protein [Sphingobacterium alkalisoli]TJY61496.1 ParM/StbA family protein [Sphingobacterium alkalisoli]GGH30038.1 hypothetical protein GCM10011418_41780 [Sphingobacterium alkalisoli]